MKASTIISALTATAMAVGLSSCRDSKSYAELLRDETHYVNAYLADHRVVPYVPEDSVFEVGPDAPYYQLDEDGDVYMQVLDPGNEYRPALDDRVYFRFTRYALSSYVSGEEMEGDGNAVDVSGDNGLGSQFFLFANLANANSSTFGEGIQLPMKFLGSNAKVNLVVKSRKGWSTESTYVIPYLYNIRYYSSPLAPWADELDD